MLQKKLKGYWVVMYGIDLYIPYVINEGMVATYGFVYPTNHKGQNIRARSNSCLSEQGDSIHSPRFFFNGNYNSNVGKCFTLISKTDPL